MGTGRPAPGAPAAPRHLRRGRAGGSSPLLPGSAIFPLILLVALPARLSAQASTHAASVALTEAARVIEDSTARLRQLIASPPKLAIASKGSAPLDEMRALVESRRPAMESLIALDPRLALQLALSAQERALLPTPLQRDVEGYATHEGVLTVLIERRVERGPPVAHYQLKIGTATHHLYFAGESPRVRSRTKVRVRGLELGDRMAIPQL